MGFVQSVAKGYQMLWVIISHLPLPIQTFLSLIFAVFAINCLVSIIRYFLGGG